MEETKLSDDVIEQIKDFKYHELTIEQNLLIDKLILDEELKERYKRYGLCDECKQPHTGNHLVHYWCHSCNSKHFQQNFNNWTSGNDNVDKFIQNAQLKAKCIREVLEWIEYDRFENIEYLARGGFGSVQKAIWKDGGFIVKWDSENNKWERQNFFDDVVLKCLYDSQNITVEFLKEIESHILMNRSNFVVRCYGITKDPETNNFVMVMEHIPNGSLRNHLDKNFNSMGWNTKLSVLHKIAYSLKDIHSNGLVHRDFHCKNILNNNIDCSRVFITDLGLCKPANNNDDKKIFGVLPYVAPEVFRGKRYTKASDIYGFGIISYEVCTGLPPFHGRPHNEFLTMGICQGLRPERPNYKIPQLILDIINKCWDADPLKRPKAEELQELYLNLSHGIYNEDSIINKQIIEANEFNKKVLSSSTGNNTLSYTTNPQAIYTSRLLDFKNLPEPKNAIDNEENSFESEYSESVKLDFVKFNIDSKDE